MSWPDDNIPYKTWANWLLGLLESRTPSPLLGIGSLDGAGKSTFFQWCAEVQPHSDRNISYSYWNLKYLAPHSVSDVWKSLNSFLEDGLSSLLKDGETIDMDTALSSSSHMFDLEKWISNPERPLRVLIIDEWEDGLRAVHQDVGMLVNEIVLSIERLMSTKCGLGVVLVTRFTSGDDLRDWARRHAEEPGGAGLVRISGLLERTLKGVTRFPYMKRDDSIKLIENAPSFRNGPRIGHSADEIAAWSGGWLSPLIAAIGSGSGINLDAGVRKADSELMKTAYVALKTHHDLESANKGLKRDLLREAFASAETDGNRYGFPLDENSKQVAKILQELTEPQKYLAVDGENLMMSFMNEWIIGAAVIELTERAIRVEAEGEPPTEYAARLLNIPETQVKKLLENRDRYSVVGWRNEMTLMRELISKIATDHRVSPHNVAVFAATRERIRDAFGAPGQWSYHAPRPEAKAGMDDYEATAWMVKTSLQDPFGELYVLSDDADWAYSAVNACRTKPTVLRPFETADGNTAPGERRGYFVVEGKVLANEGFRTKERFEKRHVDEAKRYVEARPWHGSP